jgi:lipoyl(octanoyl) transferase
MSPTVALTQLKVRNLGLIEYSEALALQRAIHSEIVDGVGVNTLLLLEHPSVYTAGRRTESHEKPVDGTPVVDVDRGGKITWHGEGQLVGYPIVKLKKSNDVVGFVREIEMALIEACREFGIEAERYCDRTGVWIRQDGRDRKIAAIGIRVAKGVTMHGFALNVNPDLSYFDRIVPCGISDAEVTSISKELGRAVTIPDVVETVTRHIQAALERVAR